MFVDRRSPTLQTTSSVGQKNQPKLLTSGLKGDDNENITKAILAGGIAALTAFAPITALAEYPEKPVSFVVPWPPGDLEDVLSRMIAEDFQAEYGVPAAVVNKPGGGGGPFPGAVEVATAPADGYTIGSFIVAVPVIGPNIGIQNCPQIRLNAGCISNLSVCDRCGR